MSALADTLRSLASVLDGRGIGWFVFGAQAVRGFVTVVPKSQTCRHT